MKHSFKTKSLAKSLVAIESCLERGYLVGLCNIGAAVANPNGNAMPDHSRSQCERAAKGAKNDEIMSNH
jgi:hypothetical protein